MGIKARWEINLPDDLPLKGKQRLTAYCGYCKKQRLGELADDGTFRIGAGWKRRDDGTYVLTKYSEKRVKRGKAPKYHTGRPSDGPFAMASSSLDVAQHNLKKLVGRIRELEAQGVSRDEASHRAWLAYGERTQVNLRIWLPTQMKCPNHLCGWINDVDAGDATP